MASGTDIQGFEFVDDVVSEGITTEIIATVGDALLACTKSARQDGVGSATITRCTDGVLYRLTGKTLQAGCGKVRRRC